MSSWKSRAAGAAAGLVAAGAFADVPDYGLDFVTVGDPGNADFVEGVWAGSVPGPVGRVDVPYRIMRTEVTVGQWYEFVQAYAPFWEGNPNTLDLTGPGLYFNGSGYTMAESIQNQATSIPWRTAARYCNWLHNGKVNEAWAFESGAYDTATFGLDENGQFTDQETRSPGARFWIPSMDEWIKAAHYDPNRYGEGEGGYWFYPTSADEQPIPGMPEDGGESLANYDPLPHEDHINVGSYPDVQSP